MADERTEQATPKRRNDARKKGQVAKSREIPGIAVLLAGVSVLYLFASYYLRELAAMMVRFFQQIGTLSLTPQNLQALAAELLQFLFMILGPLMAGVVAASFLSQFLQVGFLFSTEAVHPRLSRLFSPQRLFSMQAVMELAKSQAKIGIVGGVAFWTISKELPGIVPLMNREAGAILGYVASLSWIIFYRTALVMLLLAGLDYLYQRWSYEKGLRMTKEELKEEGKQTEGDPLIKSRIRSIQREMARKRMMAEVPKADVIVTNPTHLAVALYYDGKKLNAPQVVAKGAGFVAEKIKEIGREHGIPLVENKKLARLLFKSVEVGQLIPASLYQLAADVLAFVYRLKQKPI